MKQVTSRVTGVYRQSDYPGNPDEVTKQDLKELFEYVGSMYPDQEGPVITGPHAGIGLVALNPRLALTLLKATHLISFDERSWGSQHYALKELAVQVVNLHFRCDLCFQTHLSVASKAGISLEQQAAIPYWRTAAHMFSDDQKLVIEYTLGVLAGEVPDEVFARFAAKYGERGTVECTTAIAMWSFWAMILNATRTHFDFGHGPAES